MTFPRRDARTLVSDLRNSPQLETLRRILPDCLQSNEGTTLLRDAITDLVAQGELNPTVAEIVEFLARFALPEQSRESVEDSAETRDSKPEGSVSPAVLQTLEELSERIRATTSMVLELNDQRKEDAEHLKRASSVQYFSCSFVLSDLYAPQDAHFNPEVAIDKLIAGLLRSNDQSSSEADSDEPEQSVRVTRFEVPRSNYQHAMNVLNHLGHLLLTIVSSIEIAGEDKDPNREERRFREVVTISALAKRIGLDVESEELNQALLGVDEESDSDIPQFTLDDLALCAVCTYADPAVIPTFLENLKGPNPITENPPPDSLWLLIARAIGATGKQDLSCVPLFLREDYGGWPFVSMWRGVLPNLDTWREIVRWSLLEGEYPRGERWEELTQFCSVNIESYLWAHEGALTQLDLDALRDGGATIYNLGGSSDTSWCESRPLLRLTQCALPADFCDQNFVPQFEATCSLRSFLSSVEHDLGPPSWKERYIEILRSADSAWEQGLSHLSDAWIAYGVLSSLILAELFELGERIDWGSYFTELAARSERRAHPMTVRAVAIAEEVFSRWNRPLAVRAIKGIRSRQFDHGAVLEASSVPRSVSVIHAWPTESVKRAVRERAEEIIRGHPKMGLIFDKLDGGVRDLLIEEETRYLLLGPGTGMEWRDYGFLMKTFGQIIERFFAKLAPELTAPGDKTLGTFVHLLRVSPTELKAPKQQVAQRLQQRLKAGSNLVALLDEFNEIRRQRAAHAQVARVKHLKRFRDLVYEDGLFNLMLESFPELGNA